MFGPCTATCGGGIMTRTRACIYGSPGDDGCIGEFTEVASCNNDLCCK